MKILVLGGSGFIGSAVTEELLAAGHGVVALARSQDSAARLKDLGCETLLGDIRSPQAWLSELGKSDTVLDAIVHMASDFEPDMAEVEKGLLDALLDFLAHFPLIKTRFLITGGCWDYGDRGDEAIVEDSPFDPPADFAWMVTSRERLIAAKHVTGLILHPAMVYDGEGSVLAGFFADTRAGRPIRLVGKEGVRWPVVHRRDLAQLYRLVLEKGESGCDYHGAAEAALPVTAIAEAIAGRFGISPPFERIPLADFLAEKGSWAAGYAFDQIMPARLAKECLGWKPHHDDLLAELAAP
jgi:nucleoside-diphosphate-sugar epimerase